MARRLTEEQLIEGLLAALVLEGEQKVVTEDDEHHSRFGAAVEELEKAREDGDAGTSAMPGGINSNSISGRFRELDAALGRLQSGGMLGANNPLYPAVDLNADPRTAQALLDRFYAPEQVEVLHRLAKAYTQADISATA
jgi:hypothetical protein